MDDRRTFFSTVPPSSLAIAGSEVVAAVAFAISW